MNFVADTINKVVNKYQTREPQIIADKTGIRIVFHNFGDNIKGILIYDLIYNEGWIGIHSKLNNIMQRFIIAHELGHAFLHPESSKFFIQCSTFFSTDKIEKEANTFAAELLIKNDDIYQLLRRSESIEWIAYELEVPMELVGIKIENMNRFKKF